MPENKELKSKKNVEIFSSGVWNGDPYSNEDLDEMVRAFNETNEFIKPHLKLGHNNEQKLLQIDGMPAAGWIGGLRRIDNKLIADFIDIPKKIFELLELKAYRKVSSEIYHNIKINGKPFKRMLSAVSLLGSDMPAVSNLNDILALYGLKDYDKVTSYTAEENLEPKILEYTLLEEGEMPKSENEIKLELKVKELEKAAKESEGKLETFSKDNAELRDYKQKFEDSEKKFNEANKKIERAEFEKVVADIDTTKATRDYMLKMDKKEFSIDEVKEILKLHKVADEVNLEENSESVEPEGKDLDAKVEKYAEEHKVSYADAYKVIAQEAK
jgi:hypothetical protein